MSRHICRCPVGRRTLQRASRDSVSCIQMPMLMASRSVEHWTTSTSSDSICAVEKSQAACRTSGSARHIVWGQKDGF